MLPGMTLSVHLLPGVWVMPGYFFYMGAFNLTAAYFLSKEGKSVAVLENGESGGSYEI